jgi:hypothetical protein
MNHLAQLTGAKNIPVSCANQLKISNLTATRTAVDRRKPAATRRKPTQTGRVAPYSGL